MISNHIIGVQTRIDVISASDMNPKYFDCISTFINSWLDASKRSLNFEFNPVVYLISKSIPKSLEEFTEHIVLISPSQKIPDGFVAQNVRLLATQFSTSDLCMMSDIDMLPLNIEYFENLANYAGKDKFVVGRGDLLSCEIPICYNMASPQTFRKLVNLNSNSIEGQINEIWEILMQKSLMYDSKHGGTGWTFDQEFLFLKLKALPADHSIILSDSLLQFERLDRNSQLFRFSHLKNDLERYRYTDFHMPLPVKRNKFYIELVLKRFKIAERYDLYVLIRFLLKLPYFIFTNYWKRFIWKLRSLSLRK